MLAQLVGLVGFQAVDELMKIAVIVRCAHTSRLRHHGGTGRARPDAETRNRTRHCAVPPGHGTPAPPGGLAGVHQRLLVRVVVPSPLREDAVGQALVNAGRVLGHLGVDLVLQVNSGHFG
jgi:hypothetical protein